MCCAQSVPWIKTSSLCRKRPLSDTRDIIIFFSTSEHQVYTSPGNLMWRLLYFQIYGGIEVVALGDRSLKQRSPSASSVCDSGCNYLEIHGAMGVRAAKLITKTKICVLLVAYLFQKKIAPLVSFDKRCKYIKGFYVI